MTAKAELMEFYACPYRRCPVKWWPVSAGERCPQCRMVGTYAGVVLKQPTPPPSEDDEE